MFLLLRLVFLLTIGGYLGFQASLFAMRGECSRQGGQWTGTVCLVAETSS